MHLCFQRNNSGISKEEHTIEIRKMFPLIKIPMHSKMNYFQLEKVVCFEGERCIQTFGNISHK